MECKGKHQIQYDQEKKNVVSCESKSGGKAGHRGPGHRGRIWTLDYDPDRPEFVVTPSGPPVPTPSSVQVTCTRMNLPVSDAEIA